MQIENIYNTIYKDTEVSYTHLNMLVQPLVPTCVISRRAKKKTNTDMRLCQMKISDGTASFMPPSSEKKIFKNQCTHLAKLYKDIDNKIVFSQETNEVAFELVMELLLHLQPLSSIAIKQLSSVVRSFPSCS